jgi:biopolymer transport protein ExbD
MDGNKITLRPRKKARIEIIPLIDVIFFLLATFVLFTLSLNRIQSVPVNLPVAAPPPPPGTVPPEIVSLQVSSDGSLFWNREAIEMDELPVRITTYKSQNEDPKIILSGDERARFGTTVLVLDEIRKAGIEKFSIETKTRATGR